MPGRNIVKPIFVKRVGFLAIFRSVSKTPYPIFKVRKSYLACDAGESVRFADVPIKNENVQIFDIATKKSSFAETPVSEIGYPIFIRVRFFVSGRNTGSVP